MFDDVLENHGCKKRHFDLFLRVMLSVLVHYSKPRQLRAIAATLVGAFSVCQDKEWWIESYFLACHC